MKISALALLLLVVFLGGWFLCRLISSQQSQNLSFINTTPMKISSRAFSDNQNIPQSYACDGRDVNPPLAISDVPAEAKSLVLIVDDPDAPSGTWTHWTVWNIPPRVLEIPEKLFSIGFRPGYDQRGERWVPWPVPAFRYSSLCFSPLGPGWRVGVVAGNKAVGALGGC